jgi:hypothetical protein
MHHCPQAVGMEEVDVNGRLVAHGKATYRKYDDGDSQAVSTRSKVQLLEYVVERCAAAQRRSTPFVNNRNRT